MKTLFPTPKRWHTCPHHWSTCSGRIRLISTLPSKWTLADLTWLINIDRPSFLYCRPCQPPAPLQLMLFMHALKTLDERASKERVQSIWNKPTCRKTNICMRQLALLLSSINIDWLHRSAGDLLLGTSAELALCPGFRESVDRGREIMVLGKEMNRLPEVIYSHQYQFCPIVFSFKA